jgi:signal transduction histidine kinase
MGKDWNCTPQPPMKVLMNSKRRVPPQALLHATGKDLEERLKIMRHDLRSSIGIIQNTLFLLQEESEPASERARRFINVLLRQASQLEKIIEDSRRDERAESLSP